MRKTTIASILLAITLGAGAARADDLIPYPNGGAYNATTYAFTATATGDLIAYFVGGSGAGFNNQLGLLVNGVAQGGFGLDNHTSALGDSYNFGAVTAGDSLVFVLHNLSLSQDAFSNPALNAAYDGPDYTGGHNHIYSTAYTANPALGSVPVGVYVGFEDLPFSDTDFNYDDESFVFTNTTSVAVGVPEPASWALMLTGFFGLGATLRGRRRLRALAG